MRRAIALLACLLLIASLAGAQRKRPHTKSQPKPEDDLWVPTSSDEVLFTLDEQRAIVGHGGWRVASRGVKESDGTQTEIYYDRARVERLPKGFLRTWLKYATTKAEKLQSYSMSLEQYDCVGIRRRVLSSADYNVNGNLVVSASSPGKWEYVIPDSAGEGIFNILCHNEWDEERTDMEMAKEFFLEARQFEKKREIPKALLRYESALEHAPRNLKIIEALRRIKK